jgi:hypothetical protein
MTQKIMAFLAGPIAILAGYGAALAVRYLGPLGGLVTKDKLAVALTEAVAFGVGALVTYLGHQKWFENLAHYWDVFGKDPGAPSPAPTPEPAPQTPEPRGAVGTVPSA